MPDNKPTFFQSVMSGINGWGKGFFAGGAVGAVTGAILGAVVAAVTGAWLPILTYAVGGALFFASIGSVAGTTTEIVRSREAHQVSGQDVVNVANISFAQGISVGQQTTLAQAAEAHTAANYRKMIDEQRAQAEQNPQKTR